MKLKLVGITPPEGINLILGQSHFIKTVEDLYETLTSSSPTIKFGIAFCESSGSALVRHEGNDPSLEKRAMELAYKVAAGHLFVVLLRNAYPINVLPRIKNVEEVATIYCATANPIQVVLAETKQGRAVLGIVDGVRSKGIETDHDKKEREAFLRNLGYKK